MVSQLINKQKTIYKILQPEYIYIYKDLFLFNFKDLLSEKVMYCKQCVAIQLSSLAYS